MHIASKTSAQIIVACGLAAACGGQEGAPAAPGPAQPAAPVAAAAPATAADPVAEATQIFTLRCTPCHGPEGAGDGPASKGLVPPPRDFGDPTWQASVSDEHIDRIIQYGGAAVGKAATMPANPDLTSKPAVVAALRAHIRARKK